MTDLREEVLRISFETPSVEIIVLPGLKEDPRNEGLQTMNLQMVPFLHKKYDSDGCQFVPEHVISLQEY
jgi:hypothetical protein